MNTNVRLYLSYDPNTTLKLRIQSDNAQDFAIIRNVLMAIIP